MCPWRMFFSRTDPSETVRSGKSASISLCGVWPISCYPSELRARSKHKYKSKPLKYILAVQSTISPSTLRSDDLENLSGFE